MGGPVSTKGGGWRGGTVKVPLSGGVGGVGVGDGAPPRPGGRGTGRGEQRGWGGSRGLPLSPGLPGPPCCSCFSA